MRFEKVSLEQYLKDSKEDKFYTSTGTYSIEEVAGKRGIKFVGRFNTLSTSSLEEIYYDIPLPSRATKRSAGYDFYAPYDFTLAPGESIKIATGIRVILDDDKLLMCAPRSSHGFKSRIQLDNTVGIIDADYSESDNEGHIHLKLTNDSKQNTRIQVEKGQGMMQAIILPYFTVDDDNASRSRNGGLGSTDNN